MDEIKNLTNKELMNKYENLSMEHSKIIKEIFIRRMNHQISDEEFDKVGEMSLKATSIVLDTIPSDKMDKKYIQDRMLEGLDKCLDENR